MKQNKFETIIKNEIINEIENLILDTMEYYESIKDSYVSTKENIYTHEFYKDTLSDFLFVNNDYLTHTRNINEISNLYENNKINLDIELELTNLFGLTQKQLQYLAEICVQEGFKQYVDEKLDSLSYSIGNLLNVEPDTIYVNEDTINIGELKLIANELAIDINQEPKFTKEEIKKDLNAVHQNVNMKYFEMER